MPAVKGLGSTIMNFTLYPYGNAREKQNPDGTWAFTCQHGANECKANMIMACAIHFHPKATDYMTMVECMEGTSAPADQGKKCAGSAGFDWSEIDSCTSGSLGNQLMHATALATSGLSPPHQWTPWVVMNGKPLSQSQLDQHLVKLVCDAYTGSDKPPACTSYAKTVCLKE
jgi:interferon gamma-inducible protein 30